MKRLVVVVAIGMIAGTCYAENIYPTNEYGVRDYSKPGIVVEGDHVYQANPYSGTRDYTKPGLVIEDNKIYPTTPGGVREYGKPGYVVE